MTEGPPAEGVPCWAEDITLADGEEAGLVGAADCGEPHVYVLALDPAVWSVALTLLCTEHTAQIRELPHGGILRIATSVPAWVSCG